MSKRFDKPEIDYTRGESNYEKFGVKPYFQYFCEYHKQPFRSQAEYNEHMLKQHPGLPYDEFGDVKPFNDHDLRSMFSAEEAQLKDEFVDLYAEVQNSFDEIDDQLDEKLAGIELEYDPEERPLLYEAHHCPCCGTPDAPNIITANDIQKSASNEEAARESMLDSTNEEEADKKTKDMNDDIMALFIKNLGLWIMEFVYRVLLVFKDVPVLNELPKGLKKEIDAYAEENHLKQNKISSSHSSLRYSIDQTPDGSFTLTCNQHFGNFRTGYTSLLKDEVYKKNGDLLIYDGLSSIHGNQQTTLASVGKLMFTTIPDGWVTLKGNTWKKEEHPIQTRREKLVEKREKNRKDKQADDDLKELKKTDKNLRKKVKRIEKAEAKAQKKLENELREDAEFQKELDAYNALPTEEQVKIVDDINKKRRKKQKRDAKKQEQAHIDLENEDHVNFTDLNESGTTALMRDALNQCNNYGKQFKSMLSEWFNSEDTLCCLIYNILALPWGDPSYTDEKVYKVRHLALIKNALIGLKTALQVNLYFKMGEWDNIILSQVKTISELISKWLISQATSGLLLLKGRLKDQLKYQLKLPTLLTGIPEDSRRKCPAFEQVFLQFLPDFGFSYLFNILHIVSAMLRNWIDFTIDTEKDIEFSKNMLISIRLIDILDRMINYMDFWIECAEPGKDEQYLEEFATIVKKSDVGDAIKRLGANLENPFEPIKNVAEQLTEADDGTVPFVSVDFYKNLMINEFNKTEAEVDAALDECGCKEGFTPDDIIKMEQLFK